MADLLEFKFTLAESARNSVVGASVCSLPQRLGQCSVCLIVYPNGTFPALPKQGKQTLSAFVQVVPDVLWNDDWALPECTCSIKLVNHTSQDESIHKVETWDFHRAADGRGWHEFIQCKPGKWMKRGWLNNDGAMVFHYGLKGPFHNSQPLRKNLSRTALMWAEPKYTDVVVSTESGLDFKCHTAVLASASSVLERMLTSSMVEGKQHHILVRGVTEQDLHAFLAFIYTERLPTVAHFEGLMLLADMYQVPSLAAKCIKGMKKSLTPVTVCQAVQAVALHKRALDDTLVEDFLKGVKAKRTCIRTLLRTALRNSRSNVLREKAYDAIADDDALLDKVSGILSLGNLEHFEHVLPPVPDKE